MGIPKYGAKFCPRKAKAGGTLIYVINYLLYKTRINLKFYKSFEL